MARRFQVNVNARKCGWVPRAEYVEVQRRVADGRVHCHGLVRCGSWSSCPVCASQIAMHRTEEVRRVADAHRASGGALYLVTLTLPHDEGDRLRPLYEAVADSYRYVRTGAEWYRVKARVGFVGEIRTLEATVGAHGWHPHLHVLLFTAQQLDSLTVELLRAYLLRRWSARVQRFGYRAPSDEHGVVIVESHRDDYITKMGLADELMKGQGKFGRRTDSRTPLQVLADFAETGDTDDLNLWREWTEAMHGARQLTWSRGLRERYAAEEEKTDAEIVEGESDATEETLAAIPADIWRAAVRAAPDTTWQILQAAESGGAEAIEALIADRLDELRRRAA